MRNIPWQGAMSGYCSNVHAGSNLDEMIANLNEHAVKVKQIVSPDEPMGIGLWLSANSARAVVAENRLAELKAFLDENGLVPFTFNGFPYGDFHAPVVKHEVYKPDWSNPERLGYTIELANILAQLTPEGGSATISTLPLGWPSGTRFDWPYEAATEQFLKLAEALRILEDQTGRHISVAVEAEPGCVLDTADDIVMFFEEYLLADGDEETVLRYLGVCHDICHSAVMFEPQGEVIAAYSQAGIKVLKVHVSSAVEVDFGAMAEDDKPAAFEQLRSFHEPKYLHQTNLRQDGYIIQYEDLIDAIDSREVSNLWRSHFHVPVYLESMGLLRSTQPDIIEAVQAVRDYTDCKTFEIETYAWGVLPEQLRVDVLAEGIAAELNWFKETFAGSE